MYQTSDLFDFTHSLAGRWLCGFQYPWQALSGIRTLILELGADLGDSYREIAPQVWVHETAVIAPFRCHIDKHIRLVRRCCFVLLALVLVLMD